MRIRASADRRGTDGGRNSVLAEGAGTTRIGLRALTDCGRTETVGVSALPEGAAACGGMRALTDCGRIGSVRYRASPHGRCVGLARSGRTGLRAIADRFDHRLAHLLGRLGGEDTAVDQRVRALRQRVVGVPPFEARGHARRAHQRVVHGGLGQPRRRTGVTRGGRLHVRPERSGLDTRHPIEIRARHLVELHRELEFRQSREAFRQVIDGVVLDRQ